MEDGSDFFARLDGTVSRITRVREGDYLCLVNYCYWLVAEKSVRWEWKDLIVFVMQSALMTQFFPFLSELNKKNISHPPS